MKGLFFILMFVSLTYQSSAQEIYSHQASSAPKTARFEIVQSERGSTNTFKIDKYTGQVFRIVKKRNKDLAWEPITFLEKQAPDEVIPDKVNFQVFISGIADIYIFLLHVDTGKTWQFAEDSDSGILFWDPIE